MFRYAVSLAMAGAFALTTTSSPISTTGSWQVDARHSDVQLMTDGTTDYGKKQVNFTYGVTRVNGLVKLDDADPANSKIDLHMYPATAMAPPIGEDGNSKNRWLSELANQTLICFHSKKVARSSDGKLQVTGDLVLTRVDRNVEVNPGEDYKGPTYGPPMIHRVVREATFVFDVSGDANKEKSAGLEASGSTTMTRESFPQLLKAVLNSYWPPVVQDKKCEVNPGGSEDYRGPQCTGTFVEAAGLPPAPIHVGEDYPGASDYSKVVGKQLTIVVHMRLSPQTAGGQANGM